MGTQVEPQSCVFEEVGLKLLVGVWWDDPRYLDRPTPEAWQSMAAEARAAVRQAASWQI